LPWLLENVSSCLDEMTLRQKPNLSKPNQTKPLPQVAQLKGMGFADERAMRHALAEAGGDVAAAAQLLL
jgi:hypothetical protein